jgi:peptidoglycan/LPS O-acetylase OafA/YrhL
MKSFLKISLLLFIILAPAAFFAQDTIKTTTITSGRARALVGVVVGLTSLVIGIKSRSRSGNPIDNKSGQIKSIVALLLGMIGIILSLIHLGNSTGGFGSGGGMAGAILALILSILGLLLGWFEFGSLKAELSTWNLNKVCTSDLPELKFPIYQIREPFCIIL